MKSKRTQKSLNRKTVLLIVTGSIAAYKIGDLITVLGQQGARVLCVVTKSAKQFVTPLTLRALSGETVYDDLFAADTPFDVLHTSLAEQADLVLVAPASANFIARLSVGMADDLASCSILASKSPVVVVPAMNDQMYQHELTQANIETLKSIGYEFVEPIVGHLVCGKEAVGHVSDPQVILKQVQKSLKK